MELTRVTKFNLNISSEAEVLSYTYSGTNTREVIARVDLGDNAKPIAGFGNYYCRFYIDGVLISPDIVTVVGPSTTRTIFVSRSIPLEAGDVVTIKVVGLPADTDIDTISTLRDASPITVSDIAGPGSVMVDHNYGGTDNLSYKTSGGIGIGNASVRAYLTSNYSIGQTGNSYIVAQTITNVYGHWISPMMLDPAAYTLIYFKQGLFGPDRRDISVA